MGERDLRKQIVEGARRLLVKVGSSLLVHLGEGIDRKYLDRLASEIVKLREGGREVLLVSSGAIAAGMERLGFKRRPSSISELQATAAVGQGLLMHLYQEAFSPKGIQVAQVLLTHEDFRDRRRYLNARGTLLTLLKLGVIPVINENDSVAIEEIKLGDNDTLAALTAGLVDAQLLIILTDVEGLFIGRPGEGRLLTLVRQIDRELEAAVAGPRTEVGTGGMITKLRAASLASKAGISTIVAKGTDPGILTELLRGEVRGTLFLPSPGGLKGRKRWIGFNLKPRGTLIVDEGAKEAIVQRGKSLLPSGVKEVMGDFQRGDTVILVGPDGCEFAKGLVNYSSREIRGIMGHRSHEIEKILGYKYADEVIHRDNLVLL
ncbi:MAG: glutamate 5-kinase [Deltaproteobacteria bacterium]|nr:MAG: glutamate 5-kinase [Deltaproteobacteria bacterium]